MTHTAIALVLGMVVIGGPNVVPAQASVSPRESHGLARDYQIAAGPIDNALNTFAESSGLHVVFNADLTADLQTEGLNGSYSVREGLDRLLAGTGLTYRLSENRRTVSIVLAQNTTSSNDGSVFGVAQLPAIEIGAEANRIERGSGVRWNPRS